MDNTGKTKDMGLKLRYANNRLNYAVAGLKYRACDREEALKDVKIVKQGLRQIARANSDEIYSEESLADITEIVSLLKEWIANEGCNVNEGLILIGSTLSIALKLKELIRAVVKNPYSMEYIRSKGAQPC